MSERLEHNALPDLKELQQFHDGTLSPERMQEIRSIADENPLLRESLEGYAATSVFLPMPGFEQTGLAQLKIAAATGKGAAAASSGLKIIAQPWAWTAATKIITTVAITTAAVVGYVAVNNSTDSNKEQNTTEQQQPSTSGVGTKDATSTDALNEKVASLNSDNNAAVNAQQTLSDPAVGQHGASNQDNTGIGAERTPGQTPNEMEYIQPEVNNLGATHEEVIRAQSKHLIMVAMAEVLKYRVADYTEVRHEKWSNEVFSEGHTPANQESHGAMPKDQQQHSLKYLDYIENCLSYLDHKQYKQAKEGFDALLKFYTDDVNAQFYGAMTRYRAGEYGSAIELFKLTEINAIRAFREDAKFYRAMSMKALGKTSEAKVLFDEIITADGAYAKRAKQESGQ